MEGQQLDPKIVARYVIGYLQNQDNLIKFQLDNTEELRQLYFDLLGKTEDEDGNIVDDDLKFRMINEKGANTIISFLKPRITKIVSLSNLDNIDIDKRCLNYMQDLTFLLNRHYHEFEIPSFQVMSSIIELCDDIFFTTMKKADDAGERDTLRKTFQHVESSENIKQTQQNQPRKLFANPFGGNQ